MNSTAKSISLEEIGFYTLSDSRVLNSSVNSPLWRAELILTDNCNFTCNYCRGLKREYKKDLDYDKAVAIVDFWISEGLRNVRFSGGEPLFYKGLNNLVKKCRDANVERIAISTNGSFSRAKYDQLLADGVNDFSISLDACCDITGDMISGLNGAWKRVVSNIEYLSSKTYVTVGVVITDDNLSELVETIKFAHNLGVSDIRIIPAAQYSQKLVDITSEIDNSILNAHPILKYRIENLKQGKTVRGINERDSNKCKLVLDDMAVVDTFHYPCIIYLREQGTPIGRIDSSNVRKEREDWFKNHNTYDDPICRKNCLDVCVSYNNRTAELA